MHIDNFNASQSKFKRRKVGHSPRKSSELGHRVSYNARFNALNSCAKYSDTITVPSAREYKPNHIVLTIIMNEVKSTNPCGGPKYRSKHDQTEVFVMCDSKTHSRSTINAFKNAFDVDPVKRQNYMTTFIDRGLSDAPNVDIAAIN